MQDFEEIKKEVFNAIENAKTPEQVEGIRVSFLGRNGKITGLLRMLKDLPDDQKPVVAPRIQSLARDVQTAILQKLNDIETSSSAVDFTKPSRRPEFGHLHPLTIVQQEALSLFRDLHFSVVEGPEIENEYYNFDALNIPAHHPARDMWDTFWLKQEHGATDHGERRQPSKDRMLLRTHTSPMQVRFMETHKPPFQIVVPGRVFRYEATDATHEVNFYQLEGLMVGPDVTLANFKFIIEVFFKKFFKGQDVEFRYRPSYFPFTEPSLEVDIKVKSKKGGTQEQWLEVMGAGMVHPRVFEYAHYNPEDMQGFAFGVGIDRLLMIRHHISDVRLLYSGDLRVVEQF